MTISLPRQAELFAPETMWMGNRKSDAETITSSPLYIGCAGWSLASSVQHDFPSQGTHLERYSRILPAVEINSSFYRLHRAATYVRWRDSVPDTFRFSVKVPRSITHRLRLANARAELLEFLDSANNLQHKLGCLLLQLPPSLQFIPSVARDFFSTLRSSFDGDIVCEPRHVTWAGPEANDMLAQFRIVRVAADPPVVPMPASPTGADMVYFRLHGAPEIYHSAYSNEYLEKLAIDLAHHVQLGRRVWCILDNTASGAAIPNALFLAAHLQTKVKVMMNK